MQRKAAREALIVEQAAEITRLRGLVAETGALAARRAAMVEASEERERAIELRFWQIVDRDGLTGLFSDMWAALNQLVKDRAELVTARQDGMEEAAKRLEELHKNHNYDPESGTLTRKLGRYDRWPEAAKTAKLEHDTGYYRALAEGVAHIRAAAGEGK